MSAESLDAPGKWQYAAFISYSHTDRDAARWLHQAIERYIIPKHLRRQRGEGPRRHPARGEGREQREAVRVLRVGGEKVIL